MPTMPMRVDSYARTPAKPSKTGRTFAFVFALHVGFVLLAQMFWQPNLPAPVREVVAAALLPVFQDAPLPPTQPTAVPLPPMPRPAEVAKTVPLVQPSPALPSQAPALVQQAPSALPAITAPAATAPTAPAPVAPLVAAPAAPAPSVAPAAAVNHKPLPVIVAASARMDSCAKPRYPPASERLQEEGVVSLKFLISENGQVLSGSIEKSSGYKRLDDAALAGLSLCKFKPATVDGKPKQEWSALRYRWELSN